MDAKRLVIELRVREGRVVDPGTGADLGSPSTWARRVEMEGADDVIFAVEDEAFAWVEGVARALLLPFAVRGAFGPAQAQPILDAGADRVLVPAARFPELAAAGLPRACAGAVLAAGWSVKDGWRGTLEGLERLRDAGEVLLEAEQGPWSDLFTHTARLPFTILLDCKDPAAAAEALAWGADGAVFQAGSPTASAIKELLAPSGVLLRR